MNLRHIREPMHPLLQNALIMAVSGVVAPVLCVRVYGATLPAADSDKVSATPDIVASAPHAPAKANLVLALIGAQGPIGANGVQRTNPSGGR